MRCLLLAVVAGLAVFAVQIHAQDAGLDEEVVSLTDEQLATMLADLFDDEDFADALEQQENNRQARARGEDPSASVGEEKAVNIDPKEQARYNNFVDTFLRRLNSFSRSKFDPLHVGIAKKSGKSGNKGGSSKGKDDKKKKSSKKSNKNKKKGKKDSKKKKGRHPKDLDLDEVEVEDQPLEQEEEEVHEVVKRDVSEVEVFEIEEEEEEAEDLEEEDEEESLVRVTRDAEAEDEDQVADARRGKPAPEGKRGAAKSNKGKKNAKKGNKTKRGSKNGAKRNKNKSKKGKSNKKGDKKGSKSKRSAKKSSGGARTSRATVTGIATLQRSGDVQVVNKKGGKEMRAKFTLGPVDLRMSRRFGKGKTAQVSEARAVSPELTGKLAIHVASSGKARMTNFHIARPAIVQVEGTLHKTTKAGKNDNNLIENSLGRITPIASKKLKIASREILSASEPKSNNADS